MECRTFVQRLFARGVGTCLVHVFPLFHLNSLTQLYWTREDKRLQKRSYETGNSGFQKFPQINSGTP